MRRIQAPNSQRPFGKLIASRKVIEISQKTSRVPGCACRSGTGCRQLRSVGGYDATVEDQYFANAAAALACGYNVLAFDGPGQGGALIQQGMPIRADWGSVVTPIIDYLLARPDVDPKRIGLIGASLGAYLAPRAAAADHRLAACVADCGVYDMYAGFLNMLPEPMRKGFEASDGKVIEAVSEMLNQLAEQPTAGWSLRRGMLVHDARLMLLA